jgi:hypothetical protein
MPPRRLACLCLLAALGCSPSPTPPVEVRDSEYYPLKLGAVWTYRGPDHTRTIRVAKHEVIDGTPCALVETLRDGEVVTAEHVYATAEGVFGLTSKGEKLPAPLPVLKLPPTPGRSWRVRFKEGGKTAEGTYVLGRGTVEVPAGKYEAVTVRGELLEGGVRKMAFTHWFARGVGTVKQVIRLPEGTLTYELEKAEIPD